MGRKKLKPEDKKIKISIALDDGIFENMNTYKLNRSKFINWLLTNYFNEKGVKK